MSTTIHHVTVKDLWRLKTIFSYLSRDGWKQPDWWHAMLATKQTMMKEKA